MSRYLPVVLGVLLIVGLTIPQIQMTDRLAKSNVSAEQRAALLERIPIKVGDWVGTDQPLDPEVKRKAGAVGAVNREYHNVRTGEKVGLWLVVGHGRDVSFHTPDICYPGQGFLARAAESSVYPMEFPDRPELGKTDFLTNTFLRESSAGQQLVRVFWNWFNPENSENEGKIVWEAPKNARWHFGNTRSLYKMYFTSAMRDPKEPAEQSAGVRFARDFLPEVSRALAEVELGAQATSEAKPPAVDDGGTPLEKATESVSSVEAEQAKIKQAKEAAPADTGGVGQVDGGLIGSEKAAPKTE